MKKLIIGVFGLTFVALWLFASGQAANGATPTRCAVTNVTLDGGHLVFTEPTNCVQDLALVAYSAPGPTFQDDTANQQKVTNAIVKTNVGNGTYSWDVKLPACGYYQVDFVYGKELPNLSATNLYGSRLIAHVNGGKPCSTTTKSQVTKIKLGTSQLVIQKPCTTSTNKTAVISQKTSAPTSASTTTMTITTAAHHVAASSVHTIGSSPIKPTPVPKPTATLLRVAQKPAESQQAVSGAHLAYTGSETVWESLIAFALCLAGGVLVLSTKHEKLS